MRREQLEEYTRHGRWVRSAMYLRKSSYLYNKIRPGNPRADLSHVSALK